jgi:alpha-D-ribose 1-methylphosphonate 5-triphosphate synthase subunit PhnI
VPEVTEETLASAGSKELQDSAGALSPSKMLGDDMVPEVTEEDIRNQVNLLIEKSVNEMDEDEIAAELKAGLKDNAFTVSNFVGCDIVSNDICR